jgi:hypothetical protein
MMRISLVRARRLTVLAALFMVIAGLLCGCSGGDNNAQVVAVNSGVSGTVFLYQIIGDPNPTPLANAVITVRPAGGGLEVARQTSDANGKFKIQLLPGHYEVVPLPDTVNHLTPTGAFMTVAVASGAYTDIVVGYVRNNP